MPPHPSVPASVIPAGAVPFHPGRAPSGAMPLLPLDVVREAPLTLGLPTATLAAALGLEPPQFVQVLQGVFPLSPGADLLLRTLLADRSVAPVLVDLGPRDGHGLGSR